MRKMAGRSLGMKLKCKIAATDVACVAGVQMGGRGKVVFEREARSLKQLRPCRRSQRSPFALEINFSPPSPLYAGHAGYDRRKKSPSVSASIDGEIRSRFSLAIKFSAIGK